MSSKVEFFKGYLDSLESYYYDIEKFKKYKSDKRISSSEKKSNKSQQVIDLLEPLSLVRSSFFFKHREAY